MGATNSRYCTLLSQARWLYLLPKSMVAHVFDTNVNSKVLQQLFWLCLLCIMHMLQWSIIRHAPQVKKVAEHLPFF